MATKSIALITASTRKPRVGPDVAAFVQSILAKEDQTTPAGTTVALHAVDLASFKLPVYDEELVPGRVTSPEDFAHEHSRAWSREMKKHDAYIFVTPEYNYSIGGGFKNAIDYLYHEWIGKPAAVISYGIGGGTYVSDATKHILSNMKLRVAETRPQLAFGGLNAASMSAMNTGKLTEDTSTRWGETSKADLVKAFAEVKELLDQEPPAAPPTH